MPRARRSSPPGHPGGSPKRRTVWALALALAGIALTVLIWRHEDPGSDAALHKASESRGTSLAAAETARPSLPPAPSARPAEAETLSEELHEERVTLASGVVVEAVDTDRPWVCAGEPIQLSARVGGEQGSGAVYRWIWRATEGGAELHPGTAIAWTAPKVAGNYSVHFQVCQDLGGRRVGVLAERTVAIEVRRCGAAESQEAEPLRIGVIQRGHGSFSFQALYQGHEPVAEYAWDFGDGVSVNTGESAAEHIYPAEDLGPEKVKSFPVKLRARLASGKTHEAAAFALVRGQPLSKGSKGEELAPVALEISRWHPRPEGGWQSELAIQVQGDVQGGQGRGSGETGTGTDIQWDRLERILLHDDGRTNAITRSVDEVLTLDERLGHGGFRGRVLVSAADAAPDVRQIIDVLHGHDGAGKEVTVSWTPYKREPSPLPSPEGERPASK